MAAAVIFDIDGTIANLNHRLALIQGEKKEWTKFHEACAGDAGISPMLRLLNTIRSTGCWIYLCTGRPNWTRELTEQWLRSRGVQYELLLMREDDDYRCDVEVKRDMVKQIDLNLIEFVIEDRDRCVKMWRELGLICLQCAEGDY